MVPDHVPSATIALLVVATALFANPLYLQEDDSGNQFVEVEHVSPAEGAAMRSPAVERVDRLPVDTRHAASHAVENGSFHLDRTAPPLAIQLLATEWAYVGAHTAGQVYRPTVSVGETESTVSFAPVPVETVERDLGLTPPEGVEDSDSPREVIWLADQTDAVVFIGEFSGPWEDRLEEGVSAGAFTVAHGTTASSLAPLGGEVSFVVADDRAYRVSVVETNESVGLETTAVWTDTLLAEAAVSTVSTTDLSPSTRDIVIDAIEDEDGTARFHREDADMDELEGLTDGLVRHETGYYVVYRSHADDFSLLPLVRVALWVLGGLIGLVGIIVWYRSRRFE